MRIEVARASGRLLANDSLADAVDALGKRSALVRAGPAHPTDAQALSHEITSSALFAAPAALEQTQTLLLAKDDDDVVVGYLKTGVKHLFYLVTHVAISGKWLHIRAYTEMDPICVLDFYVDEASQRRGVGLQLFQRLLQEECETPARLAYDRPSPKLFAFLERHAQLTQYFPQPNRFVIFDAYFQQG
ncbi:hypothetical protein BBJ28_00021530 [Nothophytophthora sp. Chile5]|nr:hypothetical protein BBJ28_00021530 [Nothophytophthora sp. Chile5]